MIKIVIFDADGVLIHGERFSKKLEREYGVTREQTDTFFNGPFEKCIVGDADLKEVLPSYLQEWGWTKGVDAFLMCWFSSKHEKNQELIDYVQKLREQGILCYVATNQEKHRAQYLLNELGFEKSFDGLYASAHLREAKPNENFYAKILENHPAILKNEILFWDDTPENITAAKSFGIHAELYTKFEDFEQIMNSYDLHKKRN